MCALIALGKDEEAPVPSSTLERVLHYVARQPATYGALISRELDVVLQGVHQALETLEREGHVEGQDVRRERVYTARYTPWERDLVGLTHMAEAWAFCLHVAKHPGQENQSELEEKLGVSKGAILAAAAWLTELDVLQQASVPSTRRPGVGYAVRWQQVRPRLRLLLAKLPERHRAQEKLSKLLAQCPRA